MTPAEIEALCEEEYPVLKPARIENGCSFFYKTVQRRGQSTRIARVSQRSPRAQTMFKLSVSSRLHDKEIEVPITEGPAQVRRLLDNELALWEQKFGVPVEATEDALLVHTRPFNDVWAEIQAGARILLENEAPLYTLTNTVANRIVAVEENRIWRLSDRSQSDEASVVHRSDVERIWEELVLYGSAATPHVRYFAFALLARLIPGIGWESGPLRIFFTDRDRAMQPFHEGRDLDQPAQRPGHGTGEGAIHFALKTALAYNPLELLGETLTLVKIEYPFASGDRLDLLFRDEAGHYVCIEVEPDALPDDPVPYLQAAKYRALTALTFGVPVAEVRTLVVARTISDHMFQRLGAPYGIETRAVAVAS